MKQARKDGDPISGLDEWNVRWVGPEGYKGIVARQLKTFREAQRKRAEAVDGEDDKR